MGVLRAIRMIAGVLLAPDDAAGRAALASCLAQGNQPPTAFDRAWCDEVVESHLVDGRFCEGNVSMTIDAAGRKQRRCIPRAQLERKQEAAARDPLPARPATSAGPSRATVIVGGLALGLAAYFVLR